MRGIQTRWISNSIRFALLCAFALLSVTTALSQAQSAAADLSGTIQDQNKAVVPGATVTARNKATNQTRTVTSNDDGVYVFLNLPPTEYEITVEAANFKKAVISSIRLTVGQSAVLDVSLEIGQQSVSVDITDAATEAIETSRTNVANTIDQQRINNLPINERSATGFALTISTVGRDNGRPVGPAPTSGLNIGGQRGRSTLVQVDGADFTDNSINAARSTVSQEAVQEYQVTTNSYAPEFGRATGGIVNVVTKGGGNDFHGNVFGFIRHKSIQSRNAFAPLIDNDPGKKPPFTRGQYGLTFGGPLAKDRTFFFYSFEQRRRQESGFFTGDIIRGATSSVAIPIVTSPVGTVNPTARTFISITPAQATYVAGLVTNGQALIASGVPANIMLGVQAVCLARTYAFFASSGSTTAVNGFNPLFSPNDGSICPAISPILPSANPIGSRFILSGAPVPLTRNAQGEFVAFRPLAQLKRLFPISEASTYNSVRLDHLIVEGHQLVVRFGYNPSEITGIQDESQNQTLGQNDFSRTGIQKLRDTSFAISLTSLLSGTVVNELYFNFGRRRATFDSRVPSIAHQIAGTGFIGSNPFSPVDRDENRYQIRDNLSWFVGNHTFKFGYDFNRVNIKAKFELNFPALFNFSQQSCSSLITGCTGPAFTPIQTYGLGFPSVFIQGFGNPNSAIKNRPMAFFAQDTWKIHKNFTINYGVRYDIELTDTFAPTPFTDPLTGIRLTAQDVQTAQDALNVQQGFPRDKNNWAPRLGAAWDLRGDGKTVVRGAIGLFYDHPLLAVAFNSDIADGSQQQQSTLLPFGGPSPTALFNAFQVFHGTVVPGVTPGVAASAVYQNGLQRFDPSRFTGFGPILPFTLHVGKDFEYPYATQGNLAIERQLGKDALLSASFITVNARHLAHPQDVNIVRSNLLVENFRRFAGRAPTGLAEAGFFSLPTTCTPPAVCPPGYVVVVPGLIGINGLGQRIVSPIAANFFRKLGPNYFFISSITNGAINKATFDTLIAGSLLSPGPIYPYADVNAQLSDGNSYYNALNVELKKRFSTNIQMFATYTWSHSIDDSSDLQTLLKPQDNTNFRAERSDSLFDQRHRFVFSGVFGAPDAWKSGSGFKKFLHGFSLAPIVEIASGRPFNILAVGDANGDFQSTNERPNVRSDGTLCAAIVDANCGSFPTSGTLGRNLGITHNYFSVDLRVTRSIRIGDRFSIDVVAEGFNLFNRFNEAAANPFYEVVNAFNQRKGGKYYSFPTSSFDPRQFQFGVKLNF
jgi:hypothetical protein